ncbi:hypothetical protein GCM10022393_41120 [Aquimarina addita]|uniref:Class IIb bacteriocin, lactobin A/cerein 7B family n=1 Tax=Aquimarina addita TaxID=870485 RepID=A0ABP6UXM8_9FLAO
MTLTENQEKAQDILQQIFTNAWENDTFKEELIADPVVSIEKITGKKCNTEGTKVIIEDQTDSNIVFLNIPRKPDFENLQLTDEQLEIVAGGIVAGTAGIALAIVGLFAAGVGIGIAIR